MSQQMLPWPLFDKGLYIPKCLILSVRSKHVHAIFAFHFQGQGHRSKVTALKIDGINDFIMIYGRYSANMLSKPANIDRKYISLIINTTFNDL